jgi:hypothetical protein
MCTQTHATTLHTHSGQLLCRPCGLCLCVVFAFETVPSHACTLSHHAPHSCAFVYKCCAMRSFGSCVLGVCKVDVNANTSTSVHVRHEQLCCVWAWGLGGGLLDHAPRFDAGVLPWLQVNWAGRGKCPLCGRSARHLAHCQVRCQCSAVQCTALCVFVIKSVNSAVQYSAQQCLCLCLVHYQPCWQWCA